MVYKKIAVVTGASRGIGRAIAKKLSVENYDVQIFGRNQKKLKSLIPELTKNGSQTKYYSGDVSDEEFVNSSIQDILVNHKTIDVLINNAGIAHFEKFTESSLDHLREQIETNVIGVYNFSKAVINNMISNKNGTIVNIISQAGKHGFQYGTTYAATKHAVLGFSKSLMLEVRKHNIRVISVCPGSVETDMVAESPIHKDIKEMLKPEDISDIIYAAIKLPNRALVSELDIRPNNP